MDRSEQYYIDRDKFVRYIDHTVNPIRLEAGLKAMDLDTARECFRIIRDFNDKLEAEAA